MASLTKCCQVKSINDRIDFVEFNCYIPTEDKSREVKSAFYDELDKVCEKLSLVTSTPKLEEKWHIDQLLKITVCIRNPMQMQKIWLRLQQKGTWS